MTGSKPQPAQIIPAPAPPSVSQTARESLQSQLEFNPALTRQQVELQGQYGPQLAQQQLDISRQFTPLYRALLEQNFPQIGTLSGQVSERLASPYALTTEQQAAQDAMRQRSREQVSRNIRSEANLGGGLFGGRRELREDRALGELEQGYNLQDITLQQQQRQQAMQELISLFQLAGLNVQQPTVPQFGQSVVPSGDNLYNALVQNQGNFGIIPGVQGTPSPLWDLAGKGLGAAGSIGAAALLACHVAEELYGITDVRTILARLYVGTHDSWFLRCYRRFSRTWARWVRRSSLLKRLARPVWNQMWMTALMEMR